MENKKRAKPTLPCPCCGCITMFERDAWEICPVCFWEDDPIQYERQDYAGGANPVSLREAQENYRRFGACEVNMLQFVRSPLPEELLPAQ